MPENEPKPVEMVAGLTKDEVQAEINRRKFSSFWIENYSSDHPNNEEKRAELVAKVDTFLKWFGLEEEWHKKFTVIDTVGVHDLRLADDDGQPFYPTLGDALFSIAFNDLEIESEEEGPGHAYIKTVSEGLEFMFVGEGDFWTDRMYTNKETGAKVWAADIGEEEDSYYNDSRFFDCDSEVNFTLNFVLRVTKV